MISEKPYEVLVKRFAGSFYRKMLRSGVTAYTLDDIVQEHWLGFCRARNSFKEDLGVPFQAYLISGLQQLQQEMRRKVSRRFQEKSHLSLDTPIGEDGDSQLHEVIASEEDGVDVAIERDQQVEYLCKRLSPRARAFVQLLYRQPPELLEQFNHMRARADHASKLGVAHFCFNGVNSALVFKLMGAPRQERTRINVEIQNTLEKLNARLK